MASVIHMRGNRVGYRFDLVILGWVVSDVMCLRGQWLGAHMPGAAQGQ